MHEELTDSESLKAELLADAYLDLQDKLQESQILPNDTSLLQRWKTWLSIFGGIQLGLLVACLVVFMNFLIFNLIFHV